MKANELMIGDWINVLAYFLETNEEKAATCGYNGLKRKNCRISGIHGDLLAVDKISSEVIAYNPISITEEILKLNGIPTNGDTYIFDSDENCYLELKFENDKLWWSINLAEYLIIPLIYVHQLQHALRLCGLNNIADNIKIK